MKIDGRVERKDVIQTMPKIQSELHKSAQELKKMIEKKDDTEKREVNVIIHNIPESKSVDAAARKKHGEDSFENIVKALLGEHKSMEIDKIYRLGKKEVQEGQEGEHQTKANACRAEEEGGSWGADEGEMEPQ